MNYRRRESKIKIWESPVDFYERETGELEGIQ